MSKPQHRAWLEGAWRLILDKREISRGPDKGKLEVQYRSSATNIKKHRVRKEDLREINGNRTEPTETKSRFDDTVSGVDAKDEGSGSAKARGSYSKPVSTGDRSSRPKKTGRKRKGGRSGRGTRKRNGK